MTPDAHEILNSAETVRLDLNIFSYRGTWYWINDDILAAELRQALERLSESSFIL
jgi:hypothetical protein